MFKKRVLFTTYAKETITTAPVLPFKQVKINSNFVGDLGNYEVATTRRRCRATQQTKLWAYYILVYNFEYIFVFWLRF